MIKLSYTKVSCFEDCPYKYKLRYLDGLKTYPDQQANNALYLGTALHRGIEKDADTAIKEYYETFNVIGDEQVTEAIKLKSVIERCRNFLPMENSEHEVMIYDKAYNYIGFIDLLHDTGLTDDESGNRLYDLYDFKYSNAVDSYLESYQLHIYKMFFERNNPHKKIRNLYFLFAPKVTSKIAKDETVEMFRLRLKREVDEREPKLVKVDFDVNKIKKFIVASNRMKLASNFPKKSNKWCYFCEYRKYCETDGKDDSEIMNLPKNERFMADSSAHVRMWFYGAPFSGKTYLANQFTDVLMLNTDGNVKYIDAPRIMIRDQVKMEGRLEKRTLAWDVFKDVMAELEKKQNDYRTIVVDLVEDTYESCRLWCYEKLGIEHESDNSFKAWDYVRTEFLSTMRKLMTLDYDVILLSHEDTTKDITKKSGDKITSIKPNINEKVANKLAGMVDIVGRIVKNDDDSRVISFKTSDVVFGGSRIRITAPEIECNYESLASMIGLKGKATPPKEETAPAEKTEEPVPKRKRF